VISVQVVASGSGGNCYVVSDGATPLLLECGLPFRRIREALGFGVSRIAGCLVSHDHGDHSKAARDLAKAGVDVYTSAGTAEALGLVGHRFHIARARVAFPIGSWTVLPFETVHDAAEPLGFLLTSGAEKLLFATDTAYLKFRFPGLTHIMVEANYDLPVLKANVAAGLVDREVKRRVLRSHMSIGTLCGFLRANDLSRLREVVLLHLSDDSGDAAGFARRVREIVGRPVRVAEATTLGRVAQ
jgi:phosphoribosyl 1,2-cyclic phosphodiesterase